MFMIKKFLLLFMFLGACSYAEIDLASDHQGQTSQIADYRSFVKEGKTWKCTRWGEVSPDGNDTLSLQKWTYIIKGDTLINGTPCKKLFLNGIYECALYEQGRKVYRVGVWQNPSAVRLLYDFGLKTGDAIITNAGENWKIEVLSVDTICNSQNEPFKRMLISAGPVDESGNYWFHPPYIRIYWIEGVGSTRGPADSYYFLNDSYPAARMDAYYEDGSCLFTYAELMAEYNNNNIISTVSYSLSGTKAIYDMQGRPVSGTPRPGIYIQNGHKRVVR